MYEKGTAVRVTLDISSAGLKELEFVGRVVIDATDFMAIQFDTVIIPKVEIKAAEPLPDKPLEEVLGTEIARSDGVERPKPPKVENVRFLAEQSGAGMKKPGK